MKPMALSAQVSLTIAKHATLFFGDIKLAKSKSRSIDSNSNAKYNNDLQLRFGNGFFGDHCPPFEIRRKDWSLFSLTATKSVARVLPLIKGASIKKPERSWHRVGLQRLLPVETEPFLPWPANIAPHLISLVRQASQSPAETVTLQASMPVIMFAATKWHADLPRLPQTPTILFWLRFIGSGWTSIARPMFRFLSNQHTIMSEVLQTSNGSGEPPTAGTESSPSRAEITSLLRCFNSFKLPPTPNKDAKACAHAGYHLSIAQLSLHESLS